MGDIFWGLLKFQIFFGVLEIPDIFGGGVNGRCWVRAYVLQRRHLSELWLKQLLSGQESVTQLQQYFVGVTWVDLNASWKRKDTKALFQVF